MVDERVSTKFLKRLLNAGSVTKAARVLDRIHPADVAHVIETLNPYQIRSLIGAMFSESRVAKSLRELPHDVLSAVLYALKNDEIADILKRLQPDDAAAFATLLDEERRQNVLKTLPDDASFEIKRLLAYPPDSAGSMMTTRFLALKGDVTVAEAIQIVKDRGDDFEELFHLYITDSKSRLQGVVPLHRLLTRGESQSLIDVTISDVMTVDVTDDQEHVSHVISKYDLLAVPVVTSDQQLVGIVTVDDAIDVIYSEATEDMYKIAGITGGDRVFSPLRQTYLMRIPWTLVNLGTAFVAAFVVGLFETALAQMTTLALFMPVVAGMGGNCGSQTLTVTTRGLALGELDFSRAVPAIVKQLTVGLLIGLTAGIVTALIAFLWKQNAALGLVLFLAMTCNLLAGGLMGAAVPLALKLLGFDPALGAGILVTAITDSFGYFTLFGLATLFMQYLV